MIRVVIADAHSLVRIGLEQWLSLQDDIEVVGVACNGQEAIEVALEVMPDVVIIDVGMPVLDGVAAMTAIRDRAPGVSMIALAMFPDQTQIDAALNAGAAGYLLKDVSPLALVEVIRRVADGGMFSSAVDIVEPGRGDLPKVLLTPRELEILMLVSRGFGNKQIARMLAISDKTVKTHCGRMFQSIGVTNRTQAAIWAIKNLSSGNDALERATS
jgi:DNA-binding NarL/FixJ family response regulator